MNQITIRFEAKFDNPDGTKDGVFLTFDKELGYLDVVTLAHTANLLGLASV